MVSDNTDWTLDTNAGLLPTVPPPTALDVPFSDRIPPYGPPYISWIHHHHVARREPASFLPSPTAAHHSSLGLLTFLTTATPLYAVYFMTRRPVAYDSPCYRATAHYAPSVRQHDTEHRSGSVGCWITLDLYTAIGFAATRYAAVQTFGSAALPAHTAPFYIGFYVDPYANVGSPRYLLDAARNACLVYRASGLVLTSLPDAAACPPWTLADSGYYRIGPHTAPWIQCTSCRYCVLCWLLT